MNIEIINEFMETQLTHNKQGNGLLLNLQEQIMMLVLHINQLEDRIKELEIQNQNRIGDL